MGLILAAQGRSEHGQCWGQEGTEGSRDCSVQGRRCGERLEHKGVEIRWRQDGRTKEGSVCWRAGRVGRRMERRIVLAWVANTGQLLHTRGLAKATFGESSLLSGPQGKKEVASVTVLTLMSLPRISCEDLFDMAGG